MLPREYQQVEYIANSGNSYINTGISPSNDFGAEACYMQTGRVNSSSNVYGTIIRAGEGYFGVVINKSGNLNYSWGPSAHGVNQILQLNTNYTDKLNFQNNRYYLCCYGEFPLENESITTAPVYIFDFNKNGNNIFTAQPFIGRVYYIKFSRGSNIISHLLPCYRKSDNKPGMYDILTSTFLTNAGTGEFTVGPNA